MKPSQWRCLARKIKRLWDRHPVEIPRETTLSYVRNTYFYNHGDRSETLWQELKELCNQLGG